MTRSASSARARRVRLHTERKLSETVVVIEFTLISVISGVLLFVLADYAVPLFRDMRYEYWPYILMGLLSICYFWTEVIGHALTFVGWPIDIGHNLLYIALGMFLGVQQHFLADPQAWFALMLVVGLLDGMILVYDLALIQRQMRGANGAILEMYRAAYRRQWGSIRVNGAATVLVVAAAAFVLFLPGLAISQHGHVVAIILMAALVAYLLARSVITFNGLREKVFRAAEEELEEEEGPG